MGWVMGKYACVAGEAVAHHPVSSEVLVLKLGGWQGLHLLADMVTQVVTKPAIRAEARPSRQPEPTNDTVPLLSCRSDRSREVWCHRFANQYGFNFIRLVLLVDAINRLSFHKRGDCCAEIVAMHC